jgi:HNH endonuclease
MVHNKIQWSEAEINFLKENYNNCTNAQLFEKLNKPNIRPTSLRHKLYELGLFKMEMEYWNEAMVKFLTANYKKLGDTEIAEIFNKKFPKNKGWTKKHIEKKRRYLNLKRSSLQLKKIKERNRLAGAWVIANQKMWETRGTNPIGTIVKWGDRILIKTKSGYEFLNRFVYQKQYGKIPEGGNIYHKDGNKENCDINNLYLVMNKEQGYISRKKAAEKEMYLLLSRFEKLKGKQILFEGKTKSVTEIKKIGGSKHAVFLNNSPKVIYDSEIIEFMNKITLKSNLS